MARKALDSDSDSQKENQGVRSRMPRSRVKVENGATAASSKAKLKRVASRVDGTEDEEEPHVDEEEDHGVTLPLDSGHEEDQNETRGEEGDAEGEQDENDDQHVSPNGRKRARINEAGDAIPIMKEEKVKPPRRVTLPRDNDG